MSSYNYLQKMFQAPKYIMARNVNQISSRYLSRTDKMLTRCEISKPQALPNAYRLSWFNDTWGTTKKSVMESWEPVKEASYRRSRKLVDDVKKSGLSSVGYVSKSMKNRTNKVIWQNNNVIKRVNSSNFKTLAATGDDTSKTKNKAQRELAENWDAIRRANITKGRALVDDIRKSATSTVDDVSKSLKEKGIILSYRFVHNYNITLNLR